ncbi:16S rRNA (guanine(966)-N(2))-methyltransferase RsmD [Wandonia haliotis]|uniref:16S rRNA (Guanine(966)-N(2))-methyltransferase RsmD n=1 Tax=Wandonia haliotis TaxID=574963 RepID=A0ABP3Y3S1_9FLAO
MRIISGKLKGIRFSPPKSFPSRPTTDFAKEALFNIIANEFNIDNITVLDLCAGTGSISFEFASRDAISVTSVDQHGPSLNFIEKTAKKHELNQIQTRKQDLLTFLKQTEQTFDLIFADPPFAYKEYESIIQLVFERKLLNDTGLLILEHDKNNDFSNVPEFMYLRNYGGVNFSFFEYVTE